MGKYPETTLDIPRPGAVDGQTIDAYDGLPLSVVGSSQQRFPVAAPTGVAATDTANIQTAINAARDAGGGDVFLGAGGYLINASLKLYDAVHLWGTGANFRDTTKGTTIRTATVGSLAGVPMIDASNTLYAGVHHLTLSPAGSNSTGNTTLGISDFTDPANQAGFLTVADCSFRYFGGTVIGLHGNIAYIYRNRADDSNSHFIHLKNSAGGEGTGSDGFVAYNESGAATNNGTDSGPGANGAAIRLEGGSTYTIAFNHIYNFKYGIHVLGGGAFYRIIGNRCEKHDNDGILLDAAVSCTVLGNHCFNNGSLSSKRGIVLSNGATRNLVSANYVFNEPSYSGGTNTDDGILLSGSATRNNVTGNFIYNVNVVGIKLDTTTLNAIDGNRIDTCGNEGILVQTNSDNNAIRNNQIYKVGQTTNNTYDGIAVTNTTNLNNSIIGNVVRHGGGAAQSRYGVAVIGATNANTTVMSCDLLGAGNTGPFFDSGTTTYIRHLRGYITEAQGLGTVASGTTSIAVNHGLAFTPTVRNFAIKPTNNMGNAAKWWISNVTATQFTINVDVDPGATTATFAWSAGIFT